MQNADTPGPGWDAALYDRAFDVIPRFGEAVVDLLAPRPGLRVLDLGCGTGRLTAMIAAAGAEVTGMDGDAAMVAQARQNHPAIPFVVGRGQDFVLAEPVDAVFSNAALHWMSPPEAVAASIYRALKPGGRLVAEMGGRGNVATLIAALEQVLREQGVERPERFSPWYFPSIPEYAALLERTGFEVQYMYLFDRPTPFEGEEGMANWVAMFGAAWLAPLPVERRPRAAQRVVELTRPALYRDGGWVADYRRLRLVAVKPTA